MSASRIFQIQILILLVLAVSPTFATSTEIIEKEQPRADLSRIYKLYIEKITDGDVMARNHAFSELDKIIKHNPNDGQAYYSKGLAYHRYAYLLNWSYKTKSQTKEIFQKALANYDKAWDLKYRTAQLYYNRAETLDNLGRLQEALKDINESLRINSKRDWVFAERGAIKSRLGKTKEALADLKKAIAINPKRSTNFKKLGQLHVKAKKYELAIEDFSTAIKLAPQDETSLIERGRCYKLTGKTKLAETDFERALRNDPQNAIALKERGLLSINDGNIEQAMHDIYAGAEIDRSLSSSKRPALSPKQARALYEQTLKDYKKILNLDPHNRQALLDSGIASFGLGNWKKCIDYLRHFLSIGKLNERSDCQASAILAIAYRRLGNVDAADAAIDRIYKNKKMSASLPARIIDFLHGSINKRALAQSASTKTEKTIVRFYIAMELLERYQKDKAINRLKWIQTLGDSRADEYSLAVCELARLEPGVEKTLEHNRSTR